MNKFIPLTALAGMLALGFAVGAAQAAHVSGSYLGKLATAKQATVVVEPVGWQRSQRWWKKSHYRARRHDSDRPYRSHGVRRGH